MRFRPHRRLLADSMDERFEFSTRAELIAGILKIHEDGMPLGYDPDAITITLYFNEPDPRIGWDKTYIVQAEGYGVIGFTDGVPT